MVELSGLHEKLRAINVGRRPTRALYLSSNPAYCTVYSIMGPYRNYPNHLRTLAQDKFNKVIARLRIEVEHGFAIHQILWTWNGFHLQLKVRQGAAVGYAVSVLLANIWTCLQNNQTSLRFNYAPPEVEEYLQLSNNLRDDRSVDNQQAGAEGIII